LPPCKFGRAAFFARVGCPDGAHAGASIIFPILAISLRDSEPAELATFITVSSDFYADLGRYYVALTDSWLEARAREKSDEK